MNGPAFLNNLDTFDPGKGYWINATVAGTLDVSSGGAIASPPLAVGFRRSHASTDRPEIPYTIWGSVEADGVRVTGKDDYAVIVKMDDKIQSSCRLGQYDGFYALDISRTSDSSIQMELYIQVEDTIVEAGSIPPGKPGQIIRFDLSVQLPPRINQLHQNYPNPFNPDTWIPYQLKEDVDVVIRIYAMTGQLVSTLDLGHKPAGFYFDKEKAAYWDGRNEAGEHVSSGIYFYSIQAGDFAAIKKMIIAK